jgi:hypothetical protein
MKQSPSQTPIVAQLVKKFSAIYEIPKFHYRVNKEPAIGPYREPDPSSPQLFIQFS